MSTAMEKPAFLEVMCECGELAFMKAAGAVQLCVHASKAASTVLTGHPRTQERQG